MKVVHRVVQGCLEIGKSERESVSVLLETYQSGLSLVHKLFSSSGCQGEDAHEMYRLLRQGLGLPAVYANAALRQGRFPTPRPTLHLYAKAFTLDLTTHPPRLSLRVLEGRTRALLNTSARNLSLLLAYPPKYGEIWKDGDRFYIRFSLAIPVPEPPADPTHVVGVDVGEWCLLATSDGALYAADPLREALEEMVRLSERLRVSKRARKAYKEEQRRANLLLRASVNHFLRSLPPGSLIVLEDLRGIRQGAARSKDRRTLFHFWPYGRVRKLIMEKAEWLGHAVKIVSPAHTSVTCPCCGTVDARNRRGAEFRCTNCGFHGHADLVAALNLRNRGMPTRAMQPGPAYPLRVFVPTTSGVRESPLGGTVQGNAESKRGLGNIFKGNLKETQPSDPSFSSP